MYDTYEDDYSKDEGLKWDIVFRSSSTRDLDPEERTSLDFKEGIPGEVQKEERGLGSGFWDETAEVLGTSGHGFPFA